MIENCYILYSCDGSSEPIVSNYSGLSDYSFSFVSLQSIDSIVIEKCFYVVDLGEIECTTTNEITIASDITCNCQLSAMLLKKTLFIFVDFF